ncbi:MAG: iron chaperone [Candidatus Acidiferrales bacterium]
MPPKKTPKPPTRRPLRRASAPKTVDEYIACVPGPARTAVEKIRATIRSAVPRGAMEVISYSIPAFKSERVLVWYAAFSDHVSLFPTAAVIEQFKSEIKPFRTSKGTIQFPLDKPLPTALIKKIVKVRVKSASTR